ncbi:MAG: helix-turn-helix domain-containing protein [Alphaproteobacteria bacterium]|nr:helix-turn-helix domain-containing protein [Alphaproteobacteria bacterium]
MSSSAARALRVLDEIAASDRSLGVTEIARVLSLPAGTVFRSLDALARAGLVARYRASSRYIPGPMAEHLHRSIIARFSIREVCLPYLRQLASISGETVSLHVPVGWHAVRICSVPGMAEVMTSRPAGEAQPLHESPAGQAILAGLPKSELASYRNWSRSTLPLREGRTAPKRLSAKAGSGRGEAVFPVRAERGVIAAITIDAPFTPSGEQLSACRDVVGNVETLALAQPSLFAGPFSHLSADAITL